MALRQHKIEWEEEAPVAAPAIEATASPALMLQRMLQERAILLNRPGMSRAQQRRLIMMTAAAASSLWLALLTSANMAVKLIA